MNEFVKNDIKSNVQQKEIKEQVDLQEVPSKLEIPWKKGIYISFHFVWWYSILLYIVQ